MDIDDALLLENQLCFALYGLSRKMTSRYRPLLKPLGLTYPQYLVMLVMWEGHSGDPAQGVSAQFLCDKLMLDTGTLTPLLKRLEKQGLLLRTRDPEDERKLSIMLTIQGIELREKAKVVPITMLCQSPVAPEKLVALQAELMALLRKYE